MTLPAEAAGPRGSGPQELGDFPAFRLCLCYSGVSWHCSLPTCSECLVYGSEKPLLSQVSCGPECASLCWTPTASSQEKKGTWSLALVPAGITMQHTVATVSTLTKTVNRFMNTSVQLVASHDENVTARVLAEGCFNRHPSLHS